MNRSAYVAGGSLLLTVLILGFLTYSISTERKQRERDVAADVLFSAEAKAAYKDMEGREISLETYEDDVVVVTSWASWCPQCAGELTLLNEAVIERNDERLTVLAINRNEPKDQAQRFIATLPSLARINFVLDNQDFFFGSVDGYAMPETIFYNQAGEIVLHKRGNLTPDEVRSGFEAALSSGGD
ncbi:TlpA family protein disulfide reductase [Patescibacteria group bacterium]|nr:TlpA family protein disulfide reductase [Patescibacteria group bacterium]